MADSAERGSSTVRSRVASRGADVVQVAVRELRLLLGLLLILFVTSEVWRYAGRLSPLRLVVLASATIAIALLVVGLGLRRTVDGPAAGRATIRVALEVLTFGATLFVTFVVIGTISVDADLAAEWSGHDGGVLVSLGIGHPDLVITRELLQVATFLAVLGVVVFAVEVIADAGTRHTLVHDLLDDAAPAAPDERP